MRLFRQKLQRFRDVSFWSWVSAGLLGGAAGGMSVAWWVWGSPRLLTRSICLPFQAGLVVLSFLFVIAMGVLFVDRTLLFVRVVQQLRRPPMVAMWEPPPEPIPEMELFENPGCGLAMMVPIILMSGALTFPWFWLALRQVSIGRVLIFSAVGVPVGLYVAYREMT